MTNCQILKVQVISEYSKIFHEAEHLGIQSAGESKTAGEWRIMWQVSERQRFSLIGIFSWEEFLGISSHVN